MQTKILKIKDIIVNEKLYPREHLSQLTVKEYAKAMKDGDIFPLIEVALFEKKFLLVDGRHRLEANMHNGEEYIRADVKSNYTDVKQIYLASVKANLKHGKKLSEQDKIKIALKLRDMSYDIADISKLLHLVVSKIERIRNVKIKRQILNEKIQKHEIPTTISETTKHEEDIPIVDKLTEQIDTLQSFYDFLCDEKLKIDNTEIKTLINKIKLKLDKL